MTGPARDAADPLLRRVLGELAELRLEVAMLRAERQADDHHAALVAAAHAAMAGRAFLAAELLAAGLRRDAPGLRLAELLAGKSVKSTGRLLAGAANKRTRAGLVLRSVGSSDAGRVWCVGVSNPANTDRRVTPSARPAKI